MATTPKAAPQNPNGDDTADFGVWVSTEEEEMDLEEYSENWHQYNRKHFEHIFYPICLGEVLNERYLVEHKLGFGSFSTVWMAHDLQAKVDVALKIMASGWPDNEIDIQDEILQKVQDTSHLVTYLTTFLLRGNNCDHRVLVFPLKGPCFDPLILKRMSMATRMSAAKQLLEALENLHEAGIVHRDLNTRNCMWGMVPIHNLSRRAKYEALGQPLKQIIPDPDLWKQGELVQALEVPDNLRTEEFYLGDFGLAMKVGDPVIPPGSPPIEFCSPERLHGKEPSFACDMWSYMIIFAELYLDGCPPFFGFSATRIITSIVNSLGPLPKQWKGRCSRPGALDSWYDQGIVPDPTYALASRIAHFCPEADPIERKHVESIMSKMFVYCPEKRLTATQLLRDPSFRAIMDYYGC
ncbi:serine/threonine protein kinase [[Emmonsia] crescens]|uniref:Serine/threonine protein kinase n=1 Tax=[Emmonsia] crescens TaxID=73230 RepID=A0A2B7Z6S2_9EURO|nr:serine/threonine protein kinase [Emmonsia crescens]